MRTGDDSRAASRSCWRSKTTHTRRRSCSGCQREEKRTFESLSSTGTIWFFTLGLLGIGWLIDLFLILGMDRQADFRFQNGLVNCSVAWILPTFLGLFGVHRMYMGKWLTGILYLLTLGLFGLGERYDYWTLNGPIDDLNRRPE